jgi:hypothetical protein
MLSAPFLCWDLQKANNLMTVLCANIGCAHYARKAITANFFTNITSDVCLNVTTMLDTEPVRMGTTACTSISNHQANGPLVLITTEASAH